MTPTTVLIAASITAPPMLITVLLCYRREYYRWLWRLIGLQVTALHKPVKTRWKYEFLNNIEILYHEGAFRLLFVILRKKKRMSKNLVHILDLLDDPVVMSKTWFGIVLGDWLSRATGWVITRDETVKYERVDVPFDWEDPEPVESQAPPASPGVGEASLPPANSDVPVSATSGGVQQAASPPPPGVDKAVADKVAADKAAADKAAAEEALLLRNGFRTHEMLDQVEVWYLELRVLKDKCVAALAAGFKPEVPAAFVGGQVLPTLDAAGALVPEPEVEEQKVPPKPKKKARKEVSLARRIENYAKQMTMDVALARAFHSLTPPQFKDAVTGFIASIDEQLKTHTKWLTCWRRFPLLSCAGAGVRGSAFMRANALSAPCAICGLRRQRRRLICSCPAPTHR
jgi:hypothetical protein